MALILIRMNNMTPLDLIISSVIISDLVGYCDFPAWVIFGCWVLVLLNEHGEYLIRLQERKRKELYDL